MASAQNFRTAFNGFNREDVVHYLEYINNKHNNQVNQLTAENESLRTRLAGVPEAESQQLLVESLEDKCRELTEQLNQANARNADLTEQLTRAAERCAALEQQLAQVNVRCEDLEQAARQPAAEGTNTLSPTASDELEAYRRAERIEREAKERSELVYYQANSVLTEATSKVDGISTDITKMADEVMTQLTQLQVAVSSSKQALQDAASIMSTIRPNGN